MSELRYRKLVLSHDVLLAMLRNGDHPGYSVVNGLPEDAEFVSGRASRDRLELIVESADFEAVKSGRIPNLLPHIAQLPTPFQDCCVPPVLRIDCLCVIGCSVNGECPIHGDAAHGIDCL